MPTETDDRFTMVWYIDAVTALASHARSAGMVCPGFKIDPSATMAVVSRWPGGRMVTIPRSLSVEDARGKLAEGLLRANGYALDDLRWDTALGLAVEAMS